MFKVISELIPNTQYCINGYYSWLVSPNGEPMQLDWFCHDLQLAFEFNGAQHYSHTKYFHKTKKEFEYYKECDRTKKELCKKNSVSLIEIKYDIALTPINIAKEIKRSDLKMFSFLLKENMLALDESDLNAVTK